MTLAMRACWIVAVALNGALLAMLAYAAIDEYLHPIHSDVVVDHWLSALLWGAPLTALVVLTWAAGRLWRPQGL